MTALLFLLKGVVVGFAIAAPVGPIGVLCIRRTFADGRLAGFVTGLGASTADVLYGAIAGFGLTALSSFLPGFQQELRLAGGLFLCALGLKTFFDKPATAALRMQGRGLVQAWLTTALLKLANPVTLMSFLAVFAGAGLGQQRYGAADATTLVSGVFLGSAAWWLMLSSFVERWRRHYPEFAALAPNALGGAVVTGVTLGVAGKTLRKINRISGLVLLAFGLAALVSALR